MNTKPEHKKDLNPKNFHKPEYWDELKAKGPPAWTTLYDHTCHVVQAAEKFARQVEMDSNIARQGAILHDLGKAHPIFQKQLNGFKSNKPFRHEIASLFFLPLFPEKDNEQLIELVIGHHKSVKKDPGSKGLIDLADEYGDEQVLKHHLGNWDSWSPRAMQILHAFGIESRPLTQEEVKDTFYKVMDHCEAKVLENGYSEWRGLLMGADHFASALDNKTEEKLEKAFFAPDLTFYNRKSELFPLSLKPADSVKPHSLVVAPTGAGKTDFLLRRSQGRVFYTLPFQASINAMYKRMDQELTTNNPDLDIRVLHAASSIVSRGKEMEETVMQELVGASIKVLTPYQLSAIAFGGKGYETLIMDVKGCDVILDEIHTYSGVSQSIVLKVVSVLVHLGCRLHIGTATMPSVLYHEIRELLGGEQQVYEVKLPDNELDQFDRHNVKKISSWEVGYEVLEDAVYEEHKILVVCNKVQHAQELYENLKTRFPNTEKMLLHSRFMRRDRNNKEYDLMGKDENGQPLNRFNTADHATIVVSTQVVEVSLDISFDIMITEAAPLDAMVQRFGRINRKRNPEQAGLLKPVYVLSPPNDKKEALPYDLNTLIKSYEILPEGTLHERSLQDLIDHVYPEIQFVPIEKYAVFKENGTWNIDFLTHRPHSVLVEMLDIDTVSCITEQDKDGYLEADFEERMQMEIPVRYYQVKDLEQLSYGNRPFVIPDIAYNVEKGLLKDKIEAANLDPVYQFL